MFSCLASRTGAGSYILSSLKQLSTTADFDAIDADVRDCQFGETLAGCRREDYRSQVMDDLHPY